MSNQGRVIGNFNAGPASLPEEVLREAQANLMNWHGTGMSVMEMSHRSKEFDGIIKEAEADLRQILGVPQDYAVLFMQGGASTQFSAVPLNFAKKEDSVDYIVTGGWSEKAAKEAKKYVSTVNIAANGKKDGVYTHIPDEKTWARSETPAYTLYCANETVHGVEFHSVPESRGELVCDMSSNFMSRPVDVSKYGAIYAGAQKNVGPAGVTIVIVKESLLGNAQGITPVMLNYKTLADKDSMYNTPPCWSIYMCGLVFKWILKHGGLSEIYKRNTAKAELLYKAIDESKDFYRTSVEPQYRSNMNVVFRIRDDDAALTSKFVDGAKNLGLVGLKGHRSVGGLRASLYNATTIESVAELVKYMKRFEAEHA